MKLRSMAFGLSLSLAATSCVPEAHLFSENRHQDTGTEAEALQLKQKLKAGQAAVQEQVEIEPCVVTEAPPQLDHSFYSQSCETHGVLFASGPEVAPEALQVAADDLQHMLINRGDILGDLAAKHMQISIISPDEQAVDVPEYRALPAQFPDINFHAARAYSAIDSLPVSVLPEENLLCSSKDSYPGQRVDTHEFGHSIQDLSLNHRIPQFKDRVRKLYDTLAPTLPYQGSYTAISPSEFFADSVEGFFDAGDGAVTLQGGDGKNIATPKRSDEAEYAPAVLQLMQETFGPDDGWRPTCPQPSLSQ